ncbi:uncharacterized protein C17orf53 [Diachasma alloeum]|uniref:uncharacterized protein C17orf53 n=1 Tax=Diachasma alloeum TaxID=454923 RepID=UPI000738430F|nr:uncharacterized protein C17orf53 [Diachasma alloeum]
MSEKDEFDLEFDEEFLKEVDDSEELYYTQKSHDEVPSKRRRLESPPPPRQANQPLSTRKHHLITIFTDKTPSKPLKDSAQTPKTSSKPSGKALALAALTSVRRTPQRFPSDSPHRKILQSLQENPNSPRSRQTSAEMLKKTLVRKFPGPAGLLPDDIDPSAPPESLKTYLGLFDENDSNVTKTSPEKMNEFCTQETKKIFLEGAWMRMMDNLPPNFLDGYDIASIKDSDTERVPRLAVVIQRIDQSSGNPRVTLKDISGTMEGMMHRDLAINYPNILHSGVVLLLQDVGILSTKKTFVKTRTIIFSTDNLIAAFSEKDVVVRTPFLDAISGGNYEEMKREKAAARNVKGVTKRMRKWGEELRDDKVDSSQEKMELSQGVGNKGLIDQSSTEEPKKLITGSTSELDEASSKEPIVKEDRRELDKSQECDDFCDEDFNFEDDLFNQIDTSQFDVAKSREDEGRERRAIETVAVIEHRGAEEDIKEEQKEEVSGLERCGEISSGFGDDLLNDTDSEDEYLSQIDLDAITKSASLSN